jgi:threonine dehydratase
MHKPSPEGVARAAAKIAQLLPNTPLLETEVNGVTVWSKAESLQPIGAFKIRGAWHRLTDLSEEQRAAGVVGVSSGNHALGAEVVLYDRPGGEDRDALASRLCAERGATLVHAYADRWVIEGQGSAGLEITAQLAERGISPPTRIVAPCGGGGLTAGLALACPDAEIVPVEPEGWDDVRLSLEAGEIRRVPADAPPTACDALQTPATFPINFAVLQERCAFGLAVSPDEVRAAQRFAFEKLHLVIEPGGAAALAAALAGKVALDGRTVLILSGGNTDPDSFAKVLAG